MDCDVPFAGGRTVRVGAALTLDSDRAAADEPVLRLLLGHRMDFLAHEQTPAGHAARIVADWLNAHPGDEETRRVGERFLSRWPGIRRGEDGIWRLTDLEERRLKFHGRMVDCEGTIIADEGEHSHLPVEAILQSPNLQVAAFGFCRKKGPCGLQDACFSCPFFMTCAEFLPALDAAAARLNETLKEALHARYHDLADTCRRSLHAIHRIHEALQQPEPND